MKPHYHDDTLTLYAGDCRAILPTLADASVQCCVTSPPYYGLRDYGTTGQVGLEPSPAAYVAEMVAVFREVRRVLKDDGTLWLNLGDSYASASKGSGGATVKQMTNAGSFHDGARRFNHDVKDKDLLGIPWRVAFALQADGWYLRSDIIWAKPNPMPESVTDRPTRSHEYLFLLTKSARYYYDAKAIAEPAVQAGRERADVVVGNKGDATHHSPGGVFGADKQSGHGKRHAGFNNRYAAQMLETGAPATRNRRDVWTIPTAPYSGAHFAVMPPALVEPCILAGCPPGGTVLDPFGGSGTTAAVAERLGRRAVLIELNPSYLNLQRERTAQPSLTEVAP